MNKVTAVIALCTLASPAFSEMNEDPWLSKVTSEIEYLQHDGNSVLEWDLDAWRGRDLAKFWIKSSGEYTDSEFEEANIELVYSRALSPFWDQQFGVRHDIKPKPAGDTRNWASYGFIGTAPYFVAVDARVFVGEESSTQLLIELEREIMLTQQWVLTPELEITANGSTNRKYGEGSGLSDVELSVRLGYEPTRKFQPFVGLNARQSFGVTRRLQKAAAKSSGDVELMMGVHFWF
ncbi:MAG: copper resistance protein B [Gammaproteobacteria bacterium]|nr:copper resistance protein B [Gammaproteobacteria bacterium]